MTSYWDNPYLFFLLPVVLILGGVVLFLISRLKKDSRLSRALDLVLYEITQPQEKTKEPEKKFQEIISVMEQFYAGMSSIRESGRRLRFSGPTYFSLELALPAIGKEATFFAAVPRRHARFFEKQAESFFPHIKLEIKKEDYNIFNPKGESAAGYFKLKNNAALPVRTYSRLDADSLEVIINAFSKMEAEGEGAALQIILAPDSGSFIKEVKKVSKKYKETGSLSAPFAKSFLGGIVNVVDDLFFGKSSKKEGEKKEPVFFDEEKAKLLEEKSSRMVFRTNIRLAASAAGQEEAEQILKDLAGAFAQFSEPQGNEFEFISQKKKAKEKLLYRFIVRMFDDKQILYLNTSELTGIYHFPIGLVSAPKLKYLKAKDAPAPANLPQSGILLGRNVYRGEETEVRMARDDRRRHLYIIGQTGTGKSYFMQNLARQDIENGEGVCVIDPHGDIIEKILGWIPKERAEDVIVFDPGNIARPMGLNMLEYDSAHPEQKTVIVDELMEIFNKLFAGSPEGLGPVFQQYFRNAAMLVMEDPASGNTLLEIGRVLAEKDFRDYKISRSKNPVINSFWREQAEKAGGETSLANMVPYITSKIDNFLTNEFMRPIIMQEHSAINFRKIMDEGKILLVNLSKGKLGDLNAHLLGLIIVGRLSMAALSRGDLTEEKRRDFYLYVDEFQNVTTKSIAVILAEARKYRLILTMAHQYIAQLDEAIKNAVFGNVGSMASFRLGPDDAEFVEKQFAPVFSAQDLINIENRNVYVKLLVSGQTSRPFNIKTDPLPDSNPAIAEAIKGLSASKYGRPREEVEAEIAKKYQKI